MPNFEQNSHKFRTLPAVAILNAAFFLFAYLLICFVFPKGMTWRTKR